MNSMHLACATGCCTTSAYDKARLLNEAALQGAAAAAAADSAAAGLALLAAKLSEEAPPSCTLLSYMFKVPGWEQHLQATLPVTSVMPGRPDVSGVSKLYVYRRTS
jgi:hypothetical protein